MDQENKLARSNKGTKRKNRWKKLKAKIKQRKQELQKSNKKGRMYPKSRHSRKGYKVSNSLSNNPLKIRIDENITSNFDESWNKPSTSGITVKIINSQ